jgi:hypothetical protein
MWLTYCSKELGSIPSVASGGVDLALQLFRDVLAAVHGRESAHHRSQLQFDGGVLLLEALEHLDDALVVGRERRRAVPGERGHAILRQQTIAHEVDHAVNALGRYLQEAAAQHDQKRPVRVRRDRGPESRLHHPRRGRRRGPGVSRATCRSG